METTYKQKLKSNSLENAMEITCRQNRVKIKSNSLQDTMMVTCMQRMKREGLHGKGLKHGLCATLLALSSSGGQVGFNCEVFCKPSMSAISDVATGHIFVLYF